MIKLAEGAGSTVEIHLMWGMDCRYCKISTLAGAFQSVLTTVEAPFSQNIIYLRQLLVLSAASLGSDSTRYFPVAFGRLRIPFFIL